MFRRVFGKTELKQSAFIKPGARVVRGPDWDSKFEDNGEGFLGTFVSSDEKEGKVTVIWDSGRRLQYRASENKHDLRVYDTSPTGIRHSKINCQSCGEKNIHGIRWQCAKCKNINLCNGCYMNDKHDGSHKFYRYDAPDSKGILLDKRSVRKMPKVMAKGLFIGAEVIRGPDWIYDNDDGFDVGYITHIVPHMLTYYRGAVKVLWKHSEQVTENRVGSKGCVDVIYSRMTENAEGGYYYPDHLPDLDISHVDFPRNDSTRNISHVDFSRNTSTRTKVFSGYSSYDSTSGANISTIQPTIKCVLVGDAESDKTTLVISYTTKRFPSEYIPTVFDNYSVPLKVGDQVYTLGIFDTAGQEEYTRLRPLSYPQTDVFLVLFSVVSPVSFSNVREKWIPEITRHCPVTPILIVGTKTELRNDPVVLDNLLKINQTPVTWEKGKEMAVENGAVKYLECSILNQEELNSVFEEAVFAAIMYEPKSTRTKKACEVM